MPAYIGSFASGFMQAFLAARGLRMQQDYYKQMMSYYNYLMRMNNFDPQSGKFWNPQSGKFDSPTYVAPESADQKAFREGEEGYGGRESGGANFNATGANMAFKALTDRGVPKEVAAGFVGSMAEESNGFNPQARNPNDAGPGKDSIGWGQWNKDRLAQLYKVTGKSNYKDLTDEDNEKYFEWELDNTPTGKKTIEQLKAGKSVDDGAYIGANTYEGSKVGPTQHMDVRIGNGNMFLEKYVTQPQTTTPASTTPQATPKVEPASTKTPVTPESKPATGGQQASALPGGPPGQNQGVQVASLNPAAGVQALADRQAKARQLAAQPPQAIPLPGQRGIGSDAVAGGTAGQKPYGPPPPPTATPAAPVVPPTPAPAATPQVARPVVPTGGEYQPTTGNARQAQWVPNRSPNPPLPNTPAPVANRAPPPVAAVQPTVRPVVTPQSNPVQIKPVTPAPVQTANRGVLPPPPKPPGAPPVPGSSQQQQQAPDVTQTLAAGNLQRDAMAQQQLLNDQDQDAGVVASARGGAIPARGMTRFDAGGPAASDAMGAGTGSGVAPAYFGGGGSRWSPADMWTPTTLQDRSTLQGEINQDLYGSTTINPYESGTQLMAGAPKLNSAQQQWLGQAQSDLSAMNANPSMAGFIYGTLGQPPAATPAAPPPAPAPTPAPVAAPTPLAVEPIPATTAVNPAAGAAPAPTPTTGLQGTNTPLGTLGSTANSSLNIAGNPNYTGATNYNINSADQLAATNATPNSAEASQLQTTYLEGGGGVTAFDVGGDVSGSIAGTPPGIPQQQTIPPIYYNPATYAAYGAPVGRGVSYSSVPAYQAASVPTFEDGGAVGLDDGGDAYDPANTGDPGTDAMYQTAFYGPDQGQGGGQGMPQGEQVALTTFPHAVHTGIPMPRAQTPKFAIPRMPYMRMPYGAGRMQQRPQPEHLGNPNENMEPVGEPPQPLPQNAPPSAPQIEDGYGNPSHGLMDAITDGLHTLGRALGLEPGQSQGAIAPNVSVSANQQAFARGEGAASPEQMNQVYRIVDPSDALDNAMRNLAGLEAVHNQHLLDGDYDGAGKVAASMLMYAQKMSAKYGDEAVKRFQQGDIDKALQAMKNASDMIPDGRKVHYERTDNGNVDVAVTNMRNVVEWKATMAPKDILAYAVKAQNGSLYWDALETQAAKYDPQYKDMAAQRKQDASAAQMTTALNQMYPGQTSGPPAPQPVQPGGATLQPATNVTPQSNANNPSAPNASAPPVQPNQGTPAQDASGTSQTAIPPPGSAQRPQWPPSNYAEMSPQDRLAITKLHAEQVRQDQLNQREEFAATQQTVKERQTEQMKENAQAATERRAANAPMKAQDLTKEFEVTPPEGFLANATSFKHAAGDDTGKAVPQYMDQTFGATGVQALASAVWNGKAYNPRMRTEDIAEAIAGLTTNRYMIDPGSAKDINDDYAPRVRFDFGVRGGNGKFQAMGSLVLTQQDINQLGQLKSVFQKANAPAPQRPAIPFPGHIQPIATPSGQPGGAIPPQMPGSRGVVPGSDQLKRLMPVQLPGAMPAQPVGTTIQPYQ